MTDYISGKIQRHRGQFHALFKGKHYVSDYENGNLYESSLDHYKDGGAPILRLRQSPHVASSTNRIFYKLFSLDFNFGSGAMDVENPKVVLRVSNDGGKTWGNELEKFTGASGKYLARARWHQLGYSRDRMFQLIITDPVPVHILGAYLDVDLGTD